MQREYLGYVGAACKDGMSPEEVQYLFSDIYMKANTRQGKKVLRLFSKGIGKAKKNVMVNKQVMQQQMDINQINQQGMAKQYVYKHIDID